MVAAVAGVGLRVVGTSVGLGAVVGAPVADVGAECVKQRMTDAINMEEVDSAFA
ncbi:MAG: hypothetical protein ABJ360_09660 [Roseobacter sp.]